MISAGTIVAILMRRDDAPALIEVIETASDPLLVTPLSVYEAAVGLARVKARGQAVDAAMLDRSRAAVSAFLEATGAREIVLSADLGRRALEVAGRQGDEGAELCFARACASGYRTRLLTADPSEQGST